MLCNYVNRKRQDAVVIESAFSGYDYTTPKSDGYVYTPGYVYKTPNVTLSVRTTTRKYEYILYNFKYY